jgi:hypothetical protein
LRVKAKLLETNKQKSCQSNVKYFLLEFQRVGWEVFWPALVLAHPVQLPFIADVKLLTSARPAVLAESSVNRGGQWRLRMFPHLRFAPCIEP